MAPLDRDYDEWIWASPWAYLVFVVLVGIVVGEAVWLLT